MLVGVQQEHVVPFRLIQYPAYYQGLDLITRTELFLHMVKSLTSGDVLVNDSLNARAEPIKYLITLSLISRVQESKSMFSTW